MISKMIPTVGKYYRQQGIHPLNFSCKHFKECSACSDKFTEAKSSFIGTEYAKATLPRLLFISLDAFNSPGEPKKRSFKFVRKIAEQTGPPPNKNTHWYRTFETAWTILNRVYSYKFKKMIDLNDIAPFFAHVNSAKCCAHQLNNKQAPRKLFINCREYISPEIELLQPDIIITQGKMARKSIENKFQIISGSLSDINTNPCSHQILKLNSKQVFVFNTFHPSNYGNFHNQRKKCFPKFANLVYNFYCNSD